MDLIHFWTVRDHNGVDEWEPDSDPDRHASGHGHAFLELYARLRAAGDPVTIGQRVPAGAGCVVVSLEELSEWHRHGIPRTTLALARQMMRRRPGLVVIRNDVHPHIAAPQATTRELMPTQASVTSPTHQRVVPLLPQRGLRPRSAVRPPRVSTVVLKAYRENVPGWVSDLEEALRPQGVTLRIDDQSGDSNHGWADFSDADAALCTQLAESLGDPRRKPATKLVNAWAAHVIPLCEPHIAYLELASRDKDCVFASGASEFAAAIARLNSDEGLIRELLAASERRGHEFRTARVLDMWRAALTDIPRTTRYRVGLDIALALIQMAVGPRYAAAIRRRVPLPYPPAP